ncbi:MAG TPA: glycogen debranching protein [Rubrobacter sp.]
MISNRRRMSGLLVTAFAMLVICSYAGAAPDPGGPTRSTTDSLALKRYVAAGDRAYVIGSEDGRFPPMGWHIRGEMGGVWAHPIKLLDGYWFALDGQWIPQASKFTTGAGYAQMQFPTTNGLNVTRTEFSPDGTPVVLVGLTLQNPDSASKSVKLTMDARSEIMAAYPWGWTAPSAKDCNGKDEASFDNMSRTLTFQDSNLPCEALTDQPPPTGYAKVGASPKPVRAFTGDQYWGPVSETDRAGYLENGNGTGGELMWNLNVGGNQETTIWVAVAGSHTSQSEAQTALTAALKNPTGLLAQKVNDRKALLAKTDVSLPDATLEQAFDWGKLNMADLTRTVTNAKIRDVDEGRAYPAPVATIPKLTGIGAGYPDYPWYFGTDGAYTAYPLVASGQWDTAMNHLRSIRDVSRVVNGSTGKVVHEVVTDGSVYFGTNDDPGNTNETAEFASAVDLLWRWSGDNGFRDEMYGFVKDGMRYITSASGCPPSDPSAEGTCDDDSDGWPEGYGMVERSGMGEEKLDNTAYTWQALRALQRMAESKGDTATATWADAKADAMEARFDAAWWMKGQNLYADSLDDPGDVQLQQKHWINATPMETLLAPQNRATDALDTLESGDFTGDCGLFHTGAGGGPTGAGELKCWTLPTSVMAVAEANYGRLANDQAPFYMDSIAKQLDLEMPGALPEISPSPEYQPFVDFRERAMFMQAWSSYGVQWPVIHNFLGISPDAPAKSLSVVPDIPDSWPGLSVQNLKVGGGTMAASASRSGKQYTTEVSAPAGWKLTIGHTLPAGAKVKIVTLDGKPAAYTVVDTTRGREVRVQTTTDQPHTLVVTTG